MQNHFLLKADAPFPYSIATIRGAAKALANRLKKVLPKLVNSDQTGFMKGRFWGENIRLIDGVVNFAEAENIP